MDSDCQLFSEGHLVPAPSSSAALETERMPANHYSMPGMGNANLFEVHPFFAVSVTKFKVSNERIFQNKKLRVDQNKSLYCHPHASTPTLQTLSAVLNARTSYLVVCRAATSNTSTANNQLPRPMRRVNSLMVNPFSFHSLPITWQLDGSSHGKWCNNQKSRGLFYAILCEYKSLVPTGPGCLSQAEPWDLHHKQKCCQDSAERITSFGRGCRAKAESWEAEKS